MGLFWKEKNCLITEEIRYCRHCSLSDRDLKAGVNVILLNQQSVKYRSRVQTGATVLAKPFQKENFMPGLMIVDIVIMVIIHNFRRKILQRQQSMK